MIKIELTKEQIDTLGNGGTVEFEHQECFEQVCIKEKVEQWEPKGRGMRTGNAITYLQSIHGHLKELEAILDIRIVCFEVHPEGVYVNVSSKEDLMKVSLGKPKLDEVVMNTTLNIDGVEYQFYTFDIKE